MQWTWFPWHRYSALTHSLITPITCLGSWCLHCSLWDNLKTIQSRCPPSHITKSRLIICTEQRPLVRRPSSLIATLAISITYVAGGVTPSSTDLCRAKISRDRRRSSVTTESTVYKLGIQRSHSYHRLHNDTEHRHLVNEQIRQRHVTATVERDWSMSASQQTAHWAQGAFRLYRRQARAVKFYQNVPQQPRCLSITPWVLKIQDTVRYIRQLAYYQCRPSWRIWGIAYAPGVYNLLSSGLELPVACASFGKSLLPL